jgi:hypothetical protein
LSPLSRFFGCSPIASLGHAGRDLPSSSNSQSLNTKLGETANPPHEWLAKHAYV